MSRGILLVILFLVMELRLSRSSCPELELQRSSSEESPSYRVSSRNIMKRSNDIDYDSFVGLMGRRNADEDDILAQQKREMHDVFVGLMGRRNSESGIGRPWRRDYPETRGGIFFNKCKLRLGDPIAPKYKQVSTWAIAKAVDV
ncbi:tachykinin-3a [Chanos chanos]|uniref:Tachykinin-3a n=1 Tax=Chanos chanos TaxID=29144 RepID=A0A6J2UWV7_CHACN|nr:neurokinin-B-like [Chanos chanos]